MYPKECRYSSTATSSSVRVRLESAYEHYDNWLEKNDESIITLYRLSYVKGYLDCSYDSAMEHNDYVLARRFYQAYQLVDNMISNVMVGKELFNVSERV